MLWTCLGTCTRQKHICYISTRLSWPISQRVLCEQVYCVVRKKKDKTPEDRLKELFRGPTFRLLQPSLDNLKGKVQLINADLAETNCGLTAADKSVLVRQGPTTGSCATADECKCVSGPRRCKSAVTESDCHSSPV